MDGTNIADISDKAPSSVAGVLLGVDTLQEFSVQTHGYSAEFGRAAGGLISAVTKSGTNQLHGSGFEFHRNSALDARNSFDVAAPPGFRRNQFGGTLGGPILRNRLFFFTGYEGLRDERSITRYARLPNALAHQGLVPDAAGVLQNVGVHPTTRPYLDLLFPTPTGQDFGDGTAELAHAHLDPTDEDFWVGKIDWQAGSNDSLLFRVSRDRSDSLTSQEHPLFVESAATDTRYVTGQHQRLFSANVLNVLRFAANRTYRDNDLLPTVDIPTSLYFSEDPHWGAITVTGLVDCRIDGDDPGAVHAGRLPGGRHLHLGEGPPHLADGVRLAELSLRRVLVFALRRRVPLPQPHRVPHAAPQRHRAGGPLHRQSSRHRHQAPRAAALRVDVRAGRLARAAAGLSVSAGLRYEFVTDPNELNGAGGRAPQLRRSRVGPAGHHAGQPAVRQPVEEQPGAAPRRRLDAARRQHA